MDNNEIYYPIIRNREISVATTHKTKNVANQKKLARMFKKIDVIKNSKYIIDIYNVSGKTIDLTEFLLEHDNEILVELLNPKVLKSAVDNSDQCMYVVSALLDAGLDPGLLCFDKDIEDYHPREDYLYIINTIASKYPVDLTIFSIVMILGIL